LLPKVMVGKISKKKVDSNCSHANEGNCTDHMGIDGRPSFRSGGATVYQIGFGWLVVGSTTNRNEPRITWPYIHQKVTAPTYVSCILSGTSVISFRFGRTESPVWKRHFNRRATFLSIDLLSERKGFQPVTRTPSRLAVGDEKYVSILEFAGQPPGCGGTVKKSQNVSGVTDHAGVCRALDGVRSAAARRSTAVPPKTSTTFPLPCINQRIATRPIAFSFPRINYSVSKPWL